MKETNEEKNRIKKEWKNSLIWAFSLAVILEICYFTFLKIVEPITVKIIIFVFLGLFVFVFMLVCGVLIVIKEYKDFMQDNLKGKIVSIILLVILLIIFVMKISQVFAKYNL